MEEAGGENKIFRSFMGFMFLISAGREFLMISLRIKRVICKLGKDFRTN